MMHRRKFITSLGMSALATALVHPVPAAVPAALTVGDVMRLVMAEIPGSQPSATVDTLKHGNPELAVTGIVTTMFATVEVIRKARDVGANFIIVHEPTYYNHLDETAWLQDDAVYQFKKALLTDGNMAVWRFHDYWHRHQPDGILTGVLKRLEWGRYQNPAQPNLFEVPAITLKDLVAHAKTKLGIDRVSVVGDARQTCSRIALMPGAAGGRSQIDLIRRTAPDVLIVGEVNEWETTEYVRDARAKGDALALVVLGHVASEEPGMQWLSEWLPTKVKGVQVTAIPAANPYDQALY